MTRLVSPPCRGSHFLLANATISLDSVLSTYPGPLTYVTILVRQAVSVHYLGAVWSPSFTCSPDDKYNPYPYFRFASCLGVRLLLQAVRYSGVQCPDPHFKNRLRNRRVVQPSLVEAIVKRLVPGGKVSTWLTTLISVRPMHVSVLV